MKYLGSVKVPQKSVVRWHANVRQIEDTVNLLIDTGEDLSRPAVVRELLDILADLGKLRGNLPPIQTDLPL